MIKELGELNEKFYELYGRLYENGELLTPKQSALMGDNLLSQYKSEYELLQLKTGIEEARELYAVKSRRGKLIPKSLRFLFWKKTNKAAEILDKEILNEIKQYFDRREKALARLAEALDKENGQTPNALAAEPQSGCEKLKTDKAELQEVTEPSATETKEATATKDEGAATTDSRTGLS